MGSTGSNVRSRAPPSRSKSQLTRYSIQVFSEAFKNLRTSFLLASPEKPPRKVVVTSFEPSDGKSTVCLNLAIVLTQTGKKVLVVDGDLRRPRLQKMLHLENAVGLSSVLSGNAKPDDCVQETVVPGLHVVPSGPVPPNPSELLGSGALASFIAWAENDAEYDHVFFDSPPIMGVSDASILASEVDLALQVIQYRRYPQPMTIRAKQMIQKVGGNLVGIVLNNINMSQDESYYYYSGYYQDYYSSKQDDNSDVKKTGQQAKLEIKQKY